MTDFEKGQRVKIEYEGVVSSTDKSRVWVIPDESTARIASSAPLDSATLLAPAGWPPRAGDIWVIDGKEYHAQGGPGGVLLREVVSPDSLKDHNPVLIRRTR